MHVISAVYTVLCYLKPGHREDVEDAAENVFPNGNDIVPMAADFTEGLAWDD